MPTFNLAAYPCKRVPGGLQIVLTDRFAQAENVEVALSDLPNKMRAFAEANSDATKADSVYVSATPEGRAPRGWRVMVAAKQDSFVFDKPAQVAA